MDAFRRFRPVILVSNAASEDQTHDLRIMGPTRCQLRYRRLNVVAQVWQMSKPAGAKVKICRVDVDCFVLSVTWASGRART